MSIEQQLYEEYRKSIETQGEMMPDWKDLYSYEREAWHNVFQKALKLMEHHG